MRRTPLEPPTLYAAVAWYTAQYTLTTPTSTTQLHNRCLSVKVCYIGTISSTPQELQQCLAKALALLLPYAFSYAMDKRVFWGDANPPQSIRTVEMGSLFLVLHSLSFLLISSCHNFQNACTHHYHDDTYQQLRRNRHSNHLGQWGFVRNMA